jgi:phosphatidate cytidylyltransferase
MSEAATPPKKSDLGVRTASAVVMIAVAGSALWLGGYWWTAFVAAVALGVLWEWWGLVRAFSSAMLPRTLWIAGGLIYIVPAGLALMGLRNHDLGIALVMLVAGSVIGVDVCAYFAGRTFGGPKIAPKISPSKTWAGLAGAMVGATLVMCGWFGFMAVSSGCPVMDGPQLSRWQCAMSPVVRHGWLFVAEGVLLAVVAQSGDFFESWMKRRAGVKDSGNLIPGHGGLFDRVDGLIAVSFVLGLVGLAYRLAIARDVAGSIAN